MRFMLIVKSDERAEAGEPPSGKLIEAMGKFNDELAQAGKLLAAEGLHPSAKGARLTIANGKRTLTKGPFSEPRKLVAGYWIIQADSKEEAIEWAKRVPFEADDNWVASGGVGQIEVRRVLGPEDFPGDIDEAEWREPPAALAQPPLNAPSLKRFFCVSPVTAGTEAGIPPSPEFFAKMEAQITKMAAAGVVLGGDGLAPTAEGARVQFSNGTRIVTDGPFIETRELIGGFGILQAKSLDDVIEMSWPYLETFCEGIGVDEATSEIREMFDAADFSAELAGHATATP
jgi:hypothetical protein